MPELPEVETVVRTLRPAIVGRRILNAEFGALRVLRGLPLETAQALAGQRVRAIERYGKFIAIRLDRGYRQMRGHDGVDQRLLEIHGQQRIVFDNKHPDAAQWIVVVHRLNHDRFSEETHAVLNEKTVPELNGRQARMFPFATTSR